RVLNSVFMYEAVNHGLDMAIVNYAKVYPLHKIPEAEVQLARKLIYHDTSAGDPLQIYMQFFASQGKKTDAAPRVRAEELNVEDQLKFLIINGEKSIGKATLEDIIES